MYTSFAFQSSFSNFCAIEFYDECNICQKYSTLARIVNLNDCVRDLPWPFSIYIPAAVEGECFPRSSAIHFRAKLSRGSITIKRSVSPAASSSPSPRYLRNLSRSLQPPSFRRSPFSIPPRATESRYDAESAVPHSDEPIFRAVAIALYTTVRGYEERQRARKRLRGRMGARELQGKR